MCMAIFAKPGKVVTREQFDRFSMSNNDGYGFMYSTPDGIFSYKTLVLSEFYDSYKSHFDANQKTPFVLHFRLGTAGKKDVENCHPFKVNDNLYFVHNGILSDFRGDVNHSDTWMINEKLFKLLGNKIIENPFTAEMIEIAVGFNKFIFMSRDNYLIVNEQKGEWDNDIWYSAYHKTNSLLSRTVAALTNKTENVYDSDQQEIPMALLNTMPAENTTKNGLCVCCGDFVNKVEREDRVIIHYKGRPYLVCVWCMYHAGDKIYKTIEYLNKMGK